MNYYNEKDWQTAEVLRELIKAELIPKGHVDDRSICDVQARDLKGYTQIHFFAGIGGWSVALRLAGWPESRPIVTGSCPCQPFSAAGNGLGEADPRHLWPWMYCLIAESDFPVVVGEQVASADARQWLVGVRADMEALDYWFGAADLCAACVGTPQIRQRLFWMADARGNRLSPWTRHSGERGAKKGEIQKRLRGEPELLRIAGRLANASSDRRQRLATAAADERASRTGSRAARKLQSGSEGRCGSDGVADTACGGFGVDWRAPRQSGHTDERITAYRLGNARSTGLQDAEQKTIRGARRRQEGRADPEPSSASSFWSDSILIPCKDGKARRISAEPAFFPVADGFRSARVVSLRGSGNAIVPQAAAEFIQACEEAINLEVLKSCQTAAIS